MPTRSTEPRGRGPTRERILDAAIEVLGTAPDAGMGEIAAAAGVVRRTVYGYFPSRSDLLPALAARAATEIAAVLAASDPPGVPADAAWAAFVGRLWPLVHRYRVLVVLRRGELGVAIHAALAQVEAPLTALVRRGQDDGVFERHLPADVLSQLAWSAVFTVADHDPARERVTLPAVTTGSLLVLGVPHARALDLAEGRVPLP
ncbi:TetR/AcrR family transcriptional regulator [Cellulomonas sp. JH27-2]|uniref:TetR/AcrR family transcriptional regulator n=1 Tax=Cellulomonas sp. JH27-2 TaxID=2774139 RepID=UPI001785D469|nr:TetR/AcrR family transcriptional regulator [Cellulomonas sp. JH27-2]MBD8059986.1 TetR/AcrR family transcriptional regulator [Cellulomonas sp. JH27-2]